MATTLDRNRPFATVFNDDAGRHFEQDGQFFTANGEPWIDPSGAAPARPKKAAAAAAPEDVQLAAQMAGA